MSHGYCYLRYIGRDMVKVVVADDEVQMTAIRAQGSGGQHVNKVSTAIHLRFDIRA